MSVVGKLSALKWIEENHPENGLFRVYWKDVINPHDGGATFDENEGEGLRWEWYYKDGKMADGESIGWYPDGKVKQIRRWKNGKQDGIRYEWYDDGEPRPLESLEDKFNFIESQTIGTKWHKKSYTDGKPDGDWKIWHDNGEKYISGAYKDGKKIGTWNFWHPNGIKAEVESYKNGKRHGLYTSWWDNGQKSGEGTYKEGKRVGKWNYWDENNHIYAEREFDENSKIIYYKWMDSNILVDLRK